MTDLFEPEGPDESGSSARSVSRQFLWFVAIALISVSVVAAAAYVLRGLLFLG